MINISHLFNEDTIETKTIILSAESEVYYTDINDELLKDVKQTIIDAINNNKYYVDVTANNIVYKGKYWNDVILEISWD